MFVGWVGLAGKNSSILAVYGIQLLGRVFRIIHEHNPELAGDRRRTVFRPPLPQVLREGTQKIVFVNFMDLCKSML
ncbi:putative translation initiation factor IF2/IF5 [Helianthus annuus]|nr:putative translation initiation factor IF2/IF5 [Helianthus annuus]